MSLNILQDNVIKDYINPNFDIFNCNEITINNVPLLESQTYTAITSNLLNFSSVVPITDFFYEKMDNIVHIIGSLDATVSTGTFLFGFELSLPPGLSYTPGNKAYGITYGKRSGATRSAGLSIQPYISGTDTLVFELIRGINLSSGNILTVNLDMYIEI